MGTFHQHIVIADNRLSTSMRGTIDDHILTDDVVVADDTLRLLATELEVLRQGTDDRSLVDLVLLTHTRNVKDTHEGEDDTAITNFHVTLYIDEGEYLTIVADFRSGVNLGFGTYFACHIIYFCC